MNDSRIDCRAMFRLHALDLWREPQYQRDHWMLRRGSALRGWVADLARDYGRLRRAGGDPFAGRPITGHAVVRKLGFESRPEPRSLPEHLKFAVAMFAAATRASFQVQRELMWLSRGPRSQA